MNVDARVSSLEQRVEHVAALSAATAKGVGKDRQSRQVVLFITGSFRAAVDEAFGRWEEGAKLARAKRAEGLSSGSEPVLPWKVQVVRLCAGQLAKQGLAGQTLALVNEVDRDAVESCFCGAPPDDVSRPWILNILFTPSLAGLSARALFSRPELLQCVQKGAAGAVGYPELGIRPARFAPGPLLRAVLNDNGHADEQLREWWGRGGKGKGKGGPRPEGGKKRGAEQRASVVATADGRERKK